jgi:lipoprotein-anchoring transpeptidase ErfK/SrfK
VVDGLDEAPLGTLYRPLYFVGGWAVHGSPSVPGYPASHGCVRTADADQDFLFPPDADRLADLHPRDQSRLP